MHHQCGHEHEEEAAAICEICGRDLMAVCEGCGNPSRDCSCEECAVCHEKLDSCICE